MWYVIKEDELYHHGIKGQKWGVRRFQNPDGTLTAQGRKRYDVDIEGARKRYDEANKKLNSATGSKEFARANLEVSYANQDIKAEKIKEKLNQQKRVTSYQKRWEERYKQRGMSDEEAAVAAYQRRKVAKILAVTAGVSVAAIGAYAAYKNYGTNIDVIIPKGTTLKRVEVGDYAGVRDAFYAARGSKDPIKYAGMYGKQLVDSRANMSNDRFLAQQFGVPFYMKDKGIFQKNIAVDQTMKLASDRSARKLLQKMYDNGGSDAQGIRDVLDYMQQNWATPGSSIAAVVHRAQNSIKKGVVDRNVYEAFNIGIPIGQKNAGSAHQSFYNLLRSAGYDGIIDANDRKHSGYNAKTAAIFINKGKVHVDGMKQLTMESINRDFARAGDILRREAEHKELASQALTTLGFIPAVGAMAGLSAGLSARATSKRNDAIVREYREKHPNSDLSYNQIVRNYERNHS